MKVYVGVLDFYEDDDKRIDASSQIVGVFTTKEEVYRETLSREIVENFHFKSKKHAYLEQWTAIQDQMVFDEKFKERWEEQREDYLGEPEFQMFSTGYRYHIKEVTVDEAVGDTNKYYKKDLENLRCVLSSKNRKTED
jgi:hypothetical protein